MEKLEKIINAIDLTVRAYLVDYSNVIPMLQILVSFVFMFYIIIMVGMACYQYKLIRCYYYENAIFNFIRIGVKESFKILLVSIINVVAFFFMFMSMDQHTVVCELYDNFLMPMNSFEYAFGYFKKKSVSSVPREFQYMYVDTKDTSYHRYFPGDNADKCTPYITWRTQFPVPKVTPEIIKQVRIKYLTFLHGSENDPTLANVAKQLFPKYDVLSEEEAPEGYFDNRPEDYFDEKNQYYAVKPMYPTNHGDVPDYKIKNKFFEKYPVSLRFTLEPPISLDYDEYVKLWGIADLDKFDRNLYLYKVAGYNERSNKLIIEPVVYTREVKDIAGVEPMSRRENYTPLFDDPHHLYDEDMVRLLKAFKCENFKEIYDKSCNGEINGLLERTVLTGEQQQAIKVWHPVHSVLLLNDYYNHHMLEEVIDHPKSPFQDWLFPENKNLKFNGIKTPLYHWRNATKGAVEQSIMYNLQMYYRACTLFENWDNTTLNYDKTEVIPTTLDILALRYTAEITSLDRELMWRFEGPFGQWIWSYLYSMQWTTLRPLIESSHVPEDSRQYNEDLQITYSYVMKRLPHWCEISNPYIRQYIARVIKDVYFHQLNAMKAHGSEEANDYMKLRWYVTMHMVTWFGTHHEHSTEDGGPFDPWAALAPWHMGAVCSEIAIRIFMKNGL